MRLNPPEPLNNAGRDKWLEAIVLVALCAAAVGAVVVALVVMGGQ